MSARQKPGPPAVIKLGDLAIDPVALGSQGNAVLGIRDSGKTYTATLLAEGLFEAGIPFIAFDPIGVWRFLRVPGAGRGYPVVVAGGVDGDLPLTPAAVPALVEAAMKNGVSLVLDLFDINLSKSDWRKIVMAALRTLLHQNHQYGLRHVFIEEAAEFAPQKVTDGHVYAEMEKLARMGGNARLGYTLINQRSEEVNKALLELCDNLFLHRQKGRNSLTALSKWLDIGNVADHKAIIGTLSTLPTGECWAWLAGSDTPHLVKVPTKNSLHPDRRVMRGDSEIAKAKPVDVGAFVEGMRATLGNVEAEAKANDPKLLKAEIARLQGELRKAPAAGSSGPTPAEVEEIRRAAILQGIAEGEKRGNPAGQALMLTRVRLALDALRVDQAPEPTVFISSPSSAAAKMNTPAPARPAPPPRAPPAAPVALDGEVTAPIRKVLDAVAWWNAFGLAAPSANQVGFIAGYSPTGGTFKRYRGEARTRGLLTYPSDGRLALTEAGAELAQGPDAPPTVAALHDAVRANLDGPLVKLLDPLLEAYPETMTAEAVGEWAGYEASGGTFKRYRGQLKTLEILDYPGAGLLRAADWLFPGAN